MVDFDGNFFKLRVFWTLIDGSKTVSDFVRLFYGKFSVDWGRVQG
jgi:hypothetical protein